VADLTHFGVASVDAQAALDATKLNSIANIYSSRADINALVAIDAVAGGSPRWRKNFRRRQEW
jgi:hypothetical protein